MSLKDWFILGWSIIGVLMSGSVGTWLIVKADDLVMNTKDKRRKMMFEWLREGMVFVQKTYTGGTQQKAELMKLINQRLQDNHMTKRFTAEQIEQMLEATFVELKAKGLV